MTLFTRLSQISSGEGTSIGIEMLGGKDGQVKVRISPELGPTPANATEEEAQLRALMAAPLTLMGTPEEIDDLLTKRLSERAPIQASGAEALNSLAAKMAAASKQAQDYKAAPAKTDSDTSDPAVSATPAPKEPTKAPTLDDSF